MKVVVVVGSGSGGGKTTVVVVVDTVVGGELVVVVCGAVVVGGTVVVVALELCGRATASEPPGAFVVAHPVPTSANDTKPAAPIRLIHGNLFAPEAARAA